MKAKNKKLKENRLKKTKKALKPKRNILVKKKNKRLIKKVIKKKSDRSFKNRAKKFIRKKAIKTNKKKVLKRAFKKTIKKYKRNKHIFKKVKAQKIKDNFPAESFFKAKIKVIGIGGGGSSIVSEIGRSLNKATFIVADTDIRAFKKRPGIKHFLFGQELTHGLGTGLNTDLARRAAEKEKERIAKLFEGQDIVILIACLGGGLGSGSAKVFAEAFENFSGIIFGIFTLPFKFEGKNKHKIANKHLKELRKSLNVSITIPNERIFKVIDENTAITDAFSMVNKNLIESLESLIDLIYTPGIINIDFADLRVILKGRGNLAFLNTVEASGKNRAETVSREILHNPLYQNNNFTAEKILFNVSGSSNLNMFEVDKISRTIAEKNPKAKIIFGISKNSKYKNKIKATLLMTGAAIAADNAMAKVLMEPIPSEIPHKAGKKIKKAVSKEKNIKKKNLFKNRTKKDLSKEAYKKREEIPPVSTLLPVFNDNISAELSAKKLSIVEAPSKPKKAIRRTALDVRKIQELEENKQSVQEKEWEIPAFLRKVKFKP